MAKKDLLLGGMIKKIDESHLFEKAESQIKDKIEILPELYSLIPPLNAEEYALLESNILSEGCREPLILWFYENRYILIDGHNRHEICKKHQISFAYQIKNFAKIEEVKSWMMDNQLGRRNLTAEQTSYLRGEKYNNQKILGFKGNRYSSEGQNVLYQNVDGKQENSLINSSKGQNVLYQNVDGKQEISLVNSSEGQNVLYKNLDEKTKLSTAEKIAIQYHVTEKTIKRDAQFAKGIDLIGKENPELKKQILSGKVKINKNQIQALAKLDSLPKIESLDQIADILQADKPAKKQVKTDLEIAKEELIKVLQNKKLTADMINQARIFLNTLKEQLE